MCGIAGAIGGVDDEILAAVGRMNDAQRHRGPDAEGLWHDRSESNAPDACSVALAHRRLAIIDLSDGGRQPMLDPETGNALVFNGEVYNFREVRAELERAGVRFRSQSDTEVVLKAYGHWGTSFIDRLRGMFAAVLWDSKRRSALLLRDRLGIKPLYYATARRPGGKRVLLFASELRALLGTDLFERQLDVVGLESYLWHGFVVGPQTIVAGIRLLPQGTFATVDGKNLDVTPQRYWDLSGRSHATGGPEAVHELDAALQEAVRLHLVSDVPLGVFLSGGVDSSAVAALATRVSGSTIDTFNVAFDEKEFDESSFARAVSAQLGTNHHEVRLSQGTFRDGLGGALRSIDQPTFDAINTYFLSRAVRAAGITVALAGTGGDEIFGGYRSFKDLPKLRWVSRLAAPLPRALVRGLSGHVTRWKCGAFGAVPPQTRWGKLSDALATPELVGLYQVAYALFTEEFRHELHATGNGSSTRWGLSAERLEEWSHLLDGSSDLHAISLLELKSFIGERLLRDTDAASMAVALEARVPLLDHVVVECAARVDPSRRFHPLGRKQLLRDLALGDLDPKLFDRPKSGFVLPIERWCREELREEVEGVLTDKGLCESVGLNARALGRLWQAFQADAPGIHWSRVWACFVLLWWCREYGVGHSG